MQKLREVIAKLKLHLTALFRNIIECSRIIMYELIADETSNALYGFIKNFLSSFYHQSGLELFVDHAIEELSDARFLICF